MSSPRASRLSNGKRNYTDDRRNPRDSRFSVYVRVWDAFPINEFFLFFENPLDVNHENSSRSISRFFVRLKLISEIEESLL